MLAAGILASLLAGHWERDRHVDEVEEIEMIIARDLRSEIESLLRSQIELAADTASVLSIDPDLTREEFTFYAARIAERDRRAPLLGIGYVRRVRAEELDAFVARARADQAPNFQMPRRRDAQNLAVILYNEPAEAQRETWGTDLYAVPGAAGALIRAMDTGQPVLSERLTLLIDRDLPGSEPAGYAVYAPVYERGLPTGSVAERRRALIGWAYVPFRTDDLLATITSGTIAELVLLDRSEVVARIGEQTGASELSELPIGGLGGRWSLQLRLGPEISDALGDRSLSTLLAGLAVTALLAGLVALLAHGGRNWARSAQRATAALEARAAELERSNRDLADFAVVASHDLSEPLRVVGGYVDLLRHRYPPGRPLDAAAIGYMEAAISGVERMRATIESFLEYARLGVTIHHRERVDLADAVAGALRDLAVATSEAGAQVEVEELPVVEGDPHQLGQLFLNLIGNAIRFRRPDRRPVIQVGCRSLGDRWEICVADNGRGIAPEHLERVFEMFRRPGALETDGTGVGLAVCSRIVDLHGGEISVTSEPGAGSTFRFTLPVAPGPPPAPEAGDPRTAEVYT